MARIVKEADERRNEILDAAETLLQKRVLKNHHY